MWEASWVTYGVDFSFEKSITTMRTRRIRTASPPSGLNFSHSHVMHLIYVDGFYAHSPLSELPNEHGSQSVDEEVDKDLAPAVI